MGAIFLLLVVVLSALSGVLPWRLRGRGVKAFYLVVLPTGIAALFTMVQCSPNPAWSIPQAIECLLELLVICLCVTLPVSLLVMQKSARQAVTSGLALWTLLAITAAVFVLYGGRECQDSLLFSQCTLRVLELWVGFSFARIDLIVGVVLALLTVLGLARRWGPLVPCTILGVVAVKLFLFVFVGESCAAYEVQVAYPRAVASDINVLLFGLICGLGVGGILDSHRTRTPQPGSKDGEQTVS